MLMDRAAPKAPEVGEGVTELMWSDRHAFTIIRVESPRRIVVQQDKAARTDHNGMSESQDYSFAPNPEGATAILTLRKNGRWIRNGTPAKGGTCWLVGTHREYHDFSF